MSSDGVILQHRTKLIAHLFVDRSDNLLIGNHLKSSLPSFGFTVGLYLHQHASAEALYDLDRTLYPMARFNALVEESYLANWVPPSLIIRSMPSATSWASPRVV